MDGTIRNVRDYGAAGDGVALDTEAIQRTLDAGGIAYFPPGVYRSGTIYLRSHGGLCLERGAVLRASADFNDYNAPDVCPQNSFSAAEHANGKHLIMGIEQEDVEIFGGGVVDGASENWFTRPDPDWAGTVYAWHAMPEWRPSQLLALYECRNVHIHDISFRNSPYWTVFIHGGRGFCLHDILIRNDMKGHNGDGISIDSASQVTISDCDIEGSDDCITLRSCSRRLKNKTDCADVTVENCRLHTLQAGIRIGLGDGTRIERAVISNIVIKACMGIVLNASYASDSGAKISGIDFSNIQMSAHWPFLITDSMGDKPQTGFVHDVSFSHIRATGEYPALIWATTPESVKGLRFDDIVMDFPDEAGHGDLLHSGKNCLYCRNIWDVSLHNAEIRHGTSWESSFYAQACHNVSCEDCRFDAPSRLPEISNWHVHSDGSIYANFFR